NVTQPAVLRAAIRRGIHVRCYRGNRVFHPKVFVIHGTDKAKDIAIVGSANISFSGLEGGVEAGIHISEPRLFRQTARWFEGLFRDSATERVDEAFVRSYEKRWKRAARARVPLRRIAERRDEQNYSPTAEDADVLEDVFATITLPVGTLGFDHAGNNVRNIDRVIDVLRRYPKIGYKERSELHLLGFLEGGELSPLGRKARRCRTAPALARLWTSWVKKTPADTLANLNSRLSSFKHAASRFWRLKADVRRYFLQELTNRDERETLQAIELCCNGSAVVESLSIDDFRAMAPFVVNEGGGLSEFIERAIADYRNNKGSRSWTSNDRRIILNSW
ncbi:MAG: phospholipase D-like domain-containing protein, partial [Betaproteobacteria bacterium]